MTTVGPRGATFGAGLVALGFTLAGSTAHAQAVAADPAGTTGVTGAAVEGDEIDLPQRYPPSSVRPKLIIGGLTITGLAYGAAALSGVQWNDAPGADALKIPVVGPWIALGQNECAADDPDCGFILYLRGFLTILDGLIQAGGLGVAGEGLFMTTEADVASSPTSATIGPLQDIRPVPVLTDNVAGFGFSARF